MALFNWRNKTKNEENIEPISNEAQMLFARFLFETEPTIDDYLIEKELSKYFKNFNCSKDISKNTRQYFFNDFQVEYHEGSIPAQCTIFRPESNEHIEKNLELAYRQLWHWPEAKQVAQNCKHELILSDLMSRPLDYKLRVGLFQRFVCSVTSALRPNAIYFPTSEKLIEPATYVSEILTADKDFLYGLLNIRLFNIGDSGLLMDTIGLHSFGLPDFQIQFTNHEPGEIARLLHSYAHYIYEHGSVIKNKNTIDGIETGSKWKCLYSTSIIEPTRNILEIKA